MISTLRLKGIITLIFLLLVIVASGQLASDSSAASAHQESREATRQDNGQLLSPLVQNPASKYSLTAIDCSTTTCPSGPADLDKVISYCVVEVFANLNEHH